MKQPDAALKQRWIEFLQVKRDSYTCTNGETERMDQLPTEEKIRRIEELAIDLQK